MHAEHLSHPLTELESRDEFIARHIGPDEHAIAGMLASIGTASLSTLISETVPATIRLQRPLALPPAMPEHAALAALKSIAAKNVVKKSLIGQGYYGTHTPPVILRNLFENPGWYTAYTPYQAEIAQGRLEALLNYQQMVCDLTGMEIANASLLDEATAAAEAMTMARRISKTKGNVFFVDEAAFPQTIDVIRTRAAWFGFELVLGKPEDASQRDDVFGALLQYPNAHGEIFDLTTAIANIKGKGGVVAVASDLMALVLLKPPGEMGADIALGSSQRFGVPMGFGGPHAAFFATREAHVRSMPGRIIGVSKDARGKTAYRMALQTREQHIRREKANSNICTSQVLLANIAGMYAVWHGPLGLRVIASRIHRLAALLAGALGVTGRDFFDTVEVKVDAGETARIIRAAVDAGYNLRRVDDQTLAISLDETTTREDVAALMKIFGHSGAPVEALDAARPCAIPVTLQRREPILTHPVFNTHHTEHGMLRYMKRLQNRDLALDHAMIPLGSCTMKLNAAAEMIPVSWPEFSQMHPFAPLDQAQGYLELITGLEDQLKAITGFDAVCMQPNSGAQGEYAGLVAIRRYQAANGQGSRNVCLIPKSAHGTNPATAQMCGLEVVAVACDDSGNVDVEDLKGKAAQHAANLSCLMITYPSTHGVFEESVRDICAIIHAHGGQVYMDGANLNAQVGLCRPADIGADVSHINLHKTFAIPHGGGGPGMGPIGLKSHLAPFAPGHFSLPIPSPTLPLTGREHSSSPFKGEVRRGMGSVSAAPWGSGSILPISWMYITMMGGTGLTRATEIAILNANYVAAKLKDHYPVLYSGSQGRVAHECILDVRAIKAATGVAEIDIAKRLMDYGFHAPTVSFPVAGTLMVEPTESEDKAELDRFCAAMCSIRDEIRKIETGEWTLGESPLKHAPHTEADLVGDWTRPYSRQQAVFPLPWVAENKFWPYVNRIDDVHGDRHLFCGCVPMENYP